MAERMYDENEVLVSEIDGVYTIDIWVTEIREKLIFEIIMMLLLWPVAITAAVFILVNMPKKYMAITGSGLVLSFLLIIPIALMIRKLAKKYHREYEFKRIVVPIEVRKNSVYMDGGVTEEFRAFLENKGIPYY